ncbi:unnamed protein product [Meganyctiphanes norvegica]|uniref:Solute carrier family 35 member F1 n=1 Tax=Meganyctiphanes norvegica TaxID=48144 RepID=A0AAV2PQ83_MEGNR
MFYNIDQIFHDEVYVFFRAALERNDVGSVRWDSWVVLLLVAGFSISQFMFYLVAAFLIRDTSATALNLAVFSADFYTLITGIVLFGYKFHPLYVASFLLVTLGLTVFVLKPTPITFDEDEYESYYKEMTPERCNYINSHNSKDTIMNHAPEVESSGNHMDCDVIYHQQQPLPPQLMRQASCPECPECAYQNSWPINYDYSESMPSSPSKCRPLTQAQRRGSYSGCSTPYQSYMDLPDMEFQPTHRRSATLQRPPRVRFMLDA